jgi:hypothetical protein
VFFLENGNADSSQRNVVFLSRGETASQILQVAGTDPMQSCLCRKLFVKTMYEVSMVCTLLGANAAEGTQ